MITDKQIEEAARDIAEEYSIVNHQEYNKNILECLFKEGAHWAIDEFLKDLWNDAKEEPKTNFVLCLYDMFVGNYELNNMVQIMSKEACLTSLNAKWLNLGELFPKGFHFSTLLDYDERDVIERLWHKPSELPDTSKKGKILILFNGDNSTTVCSLDRFENVDVISFKECFRNMVKQWLYIDDLIPKKGGKE